jgi:hypothetical protein
MGNIITIIQGEDEDWAYAFPTERQAVSFDRDVSRFGTMLRPLLAAKAFDHGSIGAVDPATGILDPTFGGVVKPEQAYARLDGMPA